MDCTQLSADTPCFLMAADIGLGRASVAGGCGGGVVSGTVDALSERASRAYSALPGMDMPHEVHTCAFLCRLLVVTSPHCSGSE